MNSDRWPNNGTTFSVNFCAFNQNEAFPEFVASGGGVKHFCISSDLKINKKRNLLEMQFLFLFFFNKNLPNIVEFSFLWRVFHEY